MQSADAERHSYGLFAHLFRRAGFGATPAEIESAMSVGYEETVEELLNPENRPDIDEDLLFRYYNDMLSSRKYISLPAWFLYRMINTRRPLEEKMTLFWHSVFATGYWKSEKARALQTQLRSLRAGCLGSFNDLLLRISRDGAMIYWLDNHLNTSQECNENYARELLELFSMGRGHYVEADVRAAARAFTGWGLKAVVPGFGPYGIFDHQFEYHADAHDSGSKRFLGEEGNFDGADIIDIISGQPATSQFVARKLYEFFVSETPDQAAIDTLAASFEDSHGELKSVLRTLFMSDFFRSERRYFCKVKSPAELVAGVLRLTGEYTVPAAGLHEAAAECGYMGQELMNPPSVEGWHGGREWISTSSMLKRAEFAMGAFSDAERPGIKAMISWIAERQPASPEDLVELCLKSLGGLAVLPPTREVLHEVARSGAATYKQNDEGRLLWILQMASGSREFQLN